MLRPEYPIETARLLLRPFAGRDLDDLYDYQSRPDVVRYLYWQQRDRGQVAEALVQKIGQATIENPGDSLVLAVVRPEMGRVVGEVNLHCRSRDHRQGEFGFVLHPDHHGRGFATEAARAVLDLGFGPLGLHRIEGRCDVRNTPSTRVMERLGMRREAHFVHNEMFKGEWGDEYVYALLDHEWTAGA